MSEINVSMQQVAVVILNYNSEQDLMISAPQLASQKHVSSRLIIVDNASSPESVEKIKTWLINWKPDAIVGTKSEVYTWVSNNPAKARASGQVYCILNDGNQGYSAGNNIGIRLAENLGADAVLIANPDIRIDNPEYIAELKKELFRYDKNFIAASRIVGLDGIDQNPLREATFWEEFFWPRFYLFKKFKQSVSYVLPIKSPTAIVVPKVSGCCFMINMSFLTKTNYLDEGVFLYCEEPILSARVRILRGNIIYVPWLSAVHAHIKSEKANASSRVLLSIKSRLYYLKHYSGYGIAKLMLLKFSYAALAMLHRIKLLVANNNF